MTKLSAVIKQLQQIYDDIGDCPICAFTASENGPVCQNFNIEFATRFKPIHIEGAYGGPSHEFVNKKCVMLFVEMRYPDEDGYDRTLAHVVKRMTLLQAFQFETGKRFKGTAKELENEMVMIQEEIRKEDLQRYTKGKG